MSSSEASDISHDDIEEDEQERQLRRSSESSEGPLVTGLTSGKSEHDGDTTGNDIHFDPKSSVLRPRDYQIEMLERSLEKNIIVAVIHPSKLTPVCANASRWIQAAGKRICMIPHLQPRDEIFPCG